MARNTLIALVLGASMLLVAAPGSASSASKDVVVVNDATQPVPTAAQGTTQVAGTVGATQAGSWSVGISNGAADPVPVSTEGGPLGAIPGLPENLLTVDVTSPNHQFLTSAPYVALTSITVTNRGNDVLSFNMNGSYEGEGCSIGTGPALRVDVQPHTTTPIELPIPLLFQRETVDCGPGPVPTTKNGFFVSSHSPGTIFQSVLLIGYTG